MPDNKKQGRTSNKAMTFFVCFLAALAGLLFGLDIGVIAGALPSSLTSSRLALTPRNGWSAP
jgi:ABC-type antimicrobial peptide transport system permease subunit